MSSGFCCFCYIYQHPKYHKKRVSLFIEGFSETFGLDNKGNIQIEDLFWETFYRFMINIFICGIIF